MKMYLLNHIIYIILSDLCLLNVSKSITKLKLSSPLSDMFVAFNKNR